MAKPVEKSVVDATRLSRATPWDRRRDGKAALALFLFVWVIYLLTASYTVNQVNDSRVTAQSSWSLATQGTLALPEAWPDYRMYVEGVDGRTYSNRFPGAILWGTPFYAITELAVPRGEVEHPWLLNYAPAGVAGATAAALAVLACFAVYRRLAERRVALGAAVVLALATGMWSVAGDALWTHGPGALALALGMQGMATQRYASGGAAFGVAILTRPQLAVVPAVVGLWEGARRRSIKPIVLVGVVSALGLAAMSTYSQTLFGTWLPVAGYGTSNVEAVASTTQFEFLRRVAATMGHHQRGIFLYSPFLLVLVPGCIRAWKHAPTWVRSSSVAGLVYMVVQLRANDFHGGSDFFGYRLALEALVLSSPLLLVAYQRFIAPVGLHRVAFAFLVGVSVLWHALGATVLETGLNGMDGVTHWQDNVEWLCEEGQPEVCEQ